MIEVLLATIVLAQSGGGADELWERYPLEPSRGPTSAPSSSPTDVNDQANSPVDGDVESGYLAALALAAAGVGAGATALVVRQRDRSDAGVGRARTASRPTAVAAGTGSGTRRRRSVSARPQTTSDKRAPSHAPRAAAGATARPVAPSTGARTGRFVSAERTGSDALADRSVWDACRVRLRRTSMFRYYTAELEGSTETIARSEGFRPDAPGDAQAALDELLRALRESGWSDVVDEHGRWTGRLRRPSTASAHR